MMLTLFPLLVLLAAVLFGAVHRSGSPTAIGLLDAVDTAYRCVAGGYPDFCDSSYPSRLAKILSAEIGAPWAATDEEIAIKHLSPGALEGKVAIVTGASAGLGEECARLLMKYGCHVVFAVRTPHKGEAVLKALQDSMPGSKGTVLTLDTSDLDSVKAFVGDFLMLGLPLHFLVMNAGIAGMSERKVSKQGHELTFATNNLGHFLLQRLLEEHMLRAGDVKSPSRIVYVSSEAQGLFANLGNGTAVQNLQQKIPPQNFHGLLTYVQSKALGVLTAIEHQKRLGASSSAIAVSVHPGLVPTQIFAKAGGSGLDAVFFGPLCKPLHKSLQQGASTYFHVLLDPKIPEEVRTEGSSNFYVNNALALQNPDLLENGVSAEAWRLSESLIKKWL